MEMERAKNISLAETAGGSHGSVHEHLAAGMQSDVVHEAAMANGVGRIVFCILLAATLTFGHRIGRSSKGILAYSSEAGIAIVMGLGAGALLYQWGSMTGSQQAFHLSAFPEDVFFFYLLPPIILNAGFQLHPARFMKYLAPILILGLAGTLLSSIFIAFGVYHVSHTATWSKAFIATLPAGVTPPPPPPPPPSDHLDHKGASLNSHALGMAQALAVGTVLSATDSVTCLTLVDQDNQPALHAILFGESVVNDATALALFHAARKYAGRGLLSSATMVALTADFVFLFTFSAALGLIVGLLSSGISRWLELAKSAIPREVAMHLVLSYLGYVTAEIMELSGIVTVFATGITLSLYADSVQELAYQAFSAPGMNEDQSGIIAADLARVATANAIQVMSSLAETSVFCYVGLAAFHYTMTALSPALPIILFVTLALARAITVCLAFISLKAMRGGFTIRQALLVWYAGLIRGAVSVALCLQLKGSRRRILLRPILSIVVLSTLFLGALARPLFQLLAPSVSSGIPLPITTPDVSGLSEVVKKSTDNKFQQVPHRRVAGQQS